MFIESLSIKNFRNYESLDLQFEPSGNLLLGDNAQGKTNLIEAIHCLITARSQRNADDENLIRQGAEYFLLKGSGQGAGDRQVNIEVRCVRQSGRQLKINGSFHHRIVDLIAFFYVVNLSPEDVDIVGGSPQQRRRFLNYCLCQASSSYWASLIEYGRILRQRNIALKSLTGRRWRPADADELEAWDRQLASVGARIMRNRGEVLSKLNPEANLFHQRVSDDGEELFLVYRPTFDLQQEGDIEGQFLAALAQQREKELKAGLTVVGPHRDDVAMTVNGMDLRPYGSQGQQRTAAIALKLAAARFLDKTRGEQPILLLDDVFAELDRHRTRLLFDLLGEFGQLFIATAKESDLAGCGQNLGRMLVSGGTVTSC